MDPSSNPNWLAFSLSNNSLFHSTSGGLVEQENVATATDHHHQHLAVLGGGGRPKLEDFLGGSSGSDAQFDGGAQAVNMADVEIYDDSELKTIAAGFLGGFCAEDTQKQLAVAAAPPPPDPPAKKAVAENFGQRTSIFRGVTRHRWTGRYEAHLWDNSCRREGQSRKGRQVYLGGYDKEEKAARAYDLAALKYWGPTTTTNFPVSDYEREMDEMKHMTRQEFVASLRRKSSGFSRGASIYRGVTRHHQHGRWQARIGRVAGNKDLYLGTFSTQEEAAEAYDIAAIKFRGLNAVTNFNMTRYDVRSIASSNLPVGGVANKPKITSSESISENKSVDAATPLSDDPNNNKLDLSSPSSITFPTRNSPPTLNFTVPVKQDHQSSSSLWAALGYQNPSSGTTIQGTPPYSMGLQAGLSINVETETETETNYSASEGFFDECGNYYQHQGDVTTTSSSDEGTTRDAVGFSGNSGNWLLPPPSVVRGLAAFQTPIFGME